MTMWHPAMYGFRPDDLEYSQAATPPPLGAAFDQWWFRGAINEPPADGTFMELPAGGVFTGEISNNKIYTSWGKKPTPDTGKMASSTQGNGLLHSLDRPFGMAPEQTKEVMGCGLGIVYESDVHKIKPEDFAIISTNRYCPWYRDVDFHIPKGLPACPEGGCHCMWGWIHNERGGGQELYFTGYRCNVTGDTGTIPLPKPAIARKCPSNKNNCTVGAKQPLYWMVAEEGRNNHQGYSDAPFYNEAYGWKNGAQDDLWDIDLGTTWLNSSDQAPIPDAAGAWHDPIIQRDANAPVGKVSGPGAVNSPDSNATPSNSSNPATDSSASVSPSGSSASTASSNPTVSASGSSSGPVVSPSAVPGLNPDDSNLKVEPSGAELPGLSFAGASSAGASSSAAAGTSAHPTGSGLSNSTVSAGSDYSSASAGSSSSTAPSGSATSGPPKKCKKRKRAHRLRL